MPKPFPCLACGADVTAEPGAEVMPCPYCGTALTIPPRLRRKARPEPFEARPESGPRDPFSAAASVRLDDETRERSRRESEMLTDGLRRAQPLATKAVQVYNSWVLASRFVPGCLAALVVACLLGCLANIALLVFLSQR
jgi:predicted RNA-binding Zn-ribbon protein involved in translation (DUF1610 family)